MKAYLKNTVNFLLLLSLLTSCKISSYVNNSDKILLTKDNIISFSGRYSDYPDTLAGIAKAYDGELKKLSLGSVISKSGTVSSEFDDGSFVQLDFKSERQLNVSFVNQGHVSEQLIIYGKIKDGYFYRRKYFAFAPFVPIFFGYSYGQFRIKMNSDGLTVDNKSKYWWFFLMAGGTRTLNCSAKYKRI